MNEGITKSLGESKTVKIELRCDDNGKGGYAVRCFEDDKEIAGRDYLDGDADCDRVAEIADNLARAYPGAPIIIVGPCAHCENLSGQWIDDDTLELEPYDPPLRP